jgi:hypothetical protein
MKKFLLFFCVFTTQFIFAERITFPTPKSEDVSTKSTSALTSKSTANSLFFSNIISEINLDKITVDQQDFTTLNLDGYVFHGLVGHPKLPAKTQLLEVPIGAKVEVNILSSEYIDIELSQKGFKNQLLPVQPRVRKNAKTPPRLAKDKAAYRQKSFNSRNLADVEYLGIMRGQGWAQLNILPVQYLPSKNMIRVYYYIEFEVNFTEQPQTKAAPAKSAAKTVPNAKVYQIISHEKFENTLATLIDWKTQKGFEVRVAYTKDIGYTTTEIKAYLQHIYETSPADYLLLVGDTDEIPAFPTTFAANSDVIYYAGGERHVTDYYYAKYTNGYLPDVLYGRLSANEPWQLQNQIEKILAMEQLTLPNLDFLGNSLLVAGYESRPTYYQILNASVNYAEQYYFNAGNNINTTLLLSPNSASQAGQIINKINSGVGFINYTGHGDWNEWYSPKIGFSHISAFENYNRYPFVISNACLTNRFNSPVCFGEALLREEGKGAVGHIGASNSTFFTEDFLWSVGSAVSISRPDLITRETSGLGIFDRMFRAAGTSFNDWANSAGEIMTFGNLAVQLSNATTNDDFKKYYWEIYHIMGDPSYMPYLFEPHPIISTHLDSISLFATSLTVQTLPFSYAGFTKEGELLAAGTADTSGLLILKLPENLSAGFAQLVITAPNHIPYFSDVFIWADRPILAFNDYKLSIGSNAVAQPFFGDTFDFSIQLKNISDFDATNVGVSLEINDDFVEIVQNAQTVSVLKVSDSVWINDFRLIVSENIPNRHNIRISAIITYSDTLQTLHHFNFIAAAPEFLVSNFSVLDMQGSLTLTNRGLSDLSGAQIQLVSQTSEISVKDFTPKTADFMINSEIPFSFELTKTQSAPEFIPYILELSVQKDDFSYVTQLYGVLGNLVEDFERGYFHNLIWSIPFEWDIDSSTAYEGNFSATSGQTSHSSSSSMLTPAFDVVGGDSIVFYYKISSEEEYDGLEFWIWVSDGAGDYGWDFMDFFSGEIPWTRASFPVNAGLQRFEWFYDKDETRSEGQDRAWVDYIQFPKMKNTPYIPIPNSIARQIPDHIAFDVVLRNGQLHVRINAETPSKAVINLVNTQGQPVAVIASNSPINIGQNDFYFDMFNLPRGVYICTFFDGNRMVSRKVVW